MPAPLEGRQRFRFTSDPLSYGGWAGSRERSNLALPTVRRCPSIFLVCARPMKKTLQELKSVVISAQAGLLLNHAPLVGRSGRALVPRICPCCQPDGGWGSNFYASRVMRRVDSFRLARDPPLKWPALVWRTPLWLEYGSGPGASRHPSKGRGNPGKQTLPGPCHPRPPPCQQDVEPFKVSVKSFLPTFTREQRTSPCR